MSVISVMEVTPNRIVPIFNYLSMLPDQKEEKNRLEKLISPKFLRPSDGEPMIKKIIREAKNMHLIEEVDGEIHLSVRNNFKEGNKALKVFNKLLFNKENDKNHDLGYCVAWMLAQNIYNPPKTFDEVSIKKKDQKIDRFLAISNSSRFDQLRYWMSFLRLGWFDPISGFFPDPTHFIKLFLEEFFSDGEKEKRIFEVIKELSSFCPVFEGGFFRDKIEEYFSEREKYDLSKTTSFALLRLEEERIIKLHERADAKGMKLKTKDTYRIVSDVEFLQNGKKKEGI